MSDDRRSVSFDRAAEFYDATREVDDRVLRETLDLLSGELRGRGRVLEIGVGTGVLALPLAERGIPVTGVDLSAAMMAKLRQKAGEKAGGRPPPLLRADATRLPVRDASFGAAYARHVFHLIPGWRTAVAELCRAVGSGVVLVDAGGAHTHWHDLWLAMREALSPEADHVGLDMARGGDEDLDAAFVDAGAVPRPLPEIPYTDEDTVAGYITEIERRTPSWTWRASDEQIRRAIEIGRRWTLDRFDTLDVRLDEAAHVRWRAFDLGRGVTARTERRVADEP